MHHSYSCSVFAFPGEDRDTGGGDGGSGLVLSREMLQDDQRTSAPRTTRVLDQHGGLDGHVDAADDLRAFERQLTGVLAAQTHQWPAFPIRR